MSDNWPFDILNEILWYITVLRQKSLNIYHEAKLIVMIEKMDSFILLFSAKYWIQFAHFVAGHFSVLNIS